MKCLHTDRCRNEARYYVSTTTDRWLLRYCGICDLAYNNGEGKLARELRAMFPALAFVLPDGKEIIL